MPSHKTQLTLLTAPKKSDVLRSGSEIAIAGLDKVDLRNLIKAEYRLYQAEVVQVHDIGGTTDPTIVADTKYTIKITTPVKEAGFDGIREASYSYTSPLSLGDADDERQSAYVALAKSINDDSKNFVVATVTATGQKMTITDDADYYPPRPANRGGANGVYLTAGFVETTHLELITAHVYEFGEGTRMVKDVPVFSPVTGNLDSGELYGQSTAVAGQQYDAIVLFYNDLGHAYNTTGQLALNPKMQVVWADNTAGADYTAFIKEIEHILYNNWKKQNNSIVEFFDAPPITLGTTIFIGSEGTSMGVNDISASGAFTWDNNGLDISPGTDTTDGNELSAPVEAISNFEFTARKQECSIRAELKITTPTNGDKLFIGFRKKEAYDVDPNGTTNSYKTLASIGFDESATAPNIDTYGKLASGTAGYSTDTSVDWAAAATHVVEVRIDADGYATGVVDDVEYIIESASGVAMRFAVDEVLIPFVFQSETGATDADIKLLKLFVIPEIIKRKY